MHPSLTAFIVRTILAHMSAPVRGADELTLLLLPAFCKKVDQEAGIKV
jgi:hypothetical protein